MPTNLPHLCYMLRPAAYGLLFGVLLGRSVSSQFYPAQWAMLAVSFFILVCAGVHVYRNPKR